MRMNICYKGEIEKNYTAEREAQLLNEGDVLQQDGANFGYSPTRQMAQRKCVSDVKRMKRGNGYDGDFVLLILVVTTPASRVGNQFNLSLIPVVASIVTIKQLMH
jgi:hypothetical protein